MGGASTYSRLSISVGGLWLGSVGPGVCLWDIGRRTSPTGPLEAPLDCPRRKTADRNNPRMAQLIAHGGYPEGGTTPHRSEGS